MAFLNNTGLEHLWAKIVSKLGTKVDKVDGKGLSTNDYTTAEKDKLAGIATGANKTTVDSALSSTSTNPVQNKVINTAITNLKTLVGDTAVSTQISTAITNQKGAVNGIATLDSSGKVPSAQLPSYVDDVIEGYYSSSKFYKTKGSDGTYSGEIAGEAGKIYVDLNTNKTYRWSGSAYAVISETLALGTTSSTAFRGDYGNTAYQHATAKGAAFSSGLYKITTNAQGHVTAATAVTKADITGLGIPAQDTTYSVATTSANGLMSKDDKSKLDGIATGANKTVVDSALSSTSTNPVQNKVVNTAISNLNTLVGDASVASQITDAVDECITGLSVSGKTITYTKGDGSTGTITTQDTNTTYSDMKGATANAAGTHGLVPAPAAGKQASFLRGDGTWVVPTDTKYSDMKGATTNAAGTHGLVPAPAKGAATRYLRSDGTWQVPPDTNTTYSNATTSAAGLMSSADKTKLDGIATGANKTTVDSSLSTTSTNPVQNKIVATEINSLKTLVGDTAVSSQIEDAIASKVDKVDGKGLSTNDYTTTEKNKLSGIASGAEVNQNAFSNIVVGATTVAADSKTDTVTFVAGKNVTITPDATNDKITITAADVAIISNDDIDSICV